MKRVAAFLVLMAALGGCATAPAPIEVTYRPPRDRSTAIADFWREERRATPMVASDFSKPDAATAYREKWQKELADQAWRDAVWKEGKTHRYFR